jgi:hypothetical protein
MEQSGDMELATDVRSRIFEDYAGWAGFSLR